jgi:hypothetical protein
MRRYIWGQSKQVGLGLEIGRAVVKLVHLEERLNKLSICNLLQAPLNISAPDKQAEATLQGLQKLKQKLNCSYQVVNSALPDYLCFSQLLPDNLINTNWKTKGLLAAAPLVPLPLDTLYFDFQKIKSTAKRAQVLGVFARKKTVQDQAKLIQASGFKLAILETECHALERGYHYLHDLAKYPDCWVCIALNCDAFTLLLWQQKFVIGNVSESLQFPDILPAVIAQLYQQLGRLLGAYTCHNLKALWVIGDHSSVELVQTEMREIFGLFKHPPSVNHHAFKARSANEWQPYYITLGLALRSINTKALENIESV